MSSLPPPSSLPRAQQQRLRQYHRCGWPCHDSVDLDLLAAGLIQRQEHEGRELMRLSDAGLAALHRATQRNRAALDRHEALIDQTAAVLVQQGRLVFRGLSFRVRVADAWKIIRPDLFSIRRTTVEDYLQPQVHEIKVNRADLLGDLRRPDKRAGYLQLAGCCTYVLADGVGTADDVPAECGVMLERENQLIALRAAPVVPRRLDFAAWMVLAHAGALRLDEDDPQRWLTETTLPPERD